MDSKKKYFIWYDFKVTMLIFAYIIFNFLTLANSYIVGDKIPLSMHLKAYWVSLPEMLCCLAIAFFITTNLFSIRNGKIKTGYYLNSLSAKRVTGISLSKVLCLHYKNKRGKEKKHKIWLFGLENNRDKYSAFLEDMISSINDAGNITIEQSTDDIISEIQQNRKQHLIPDDDKPLKRGGWIMVSGICLLLWIIYLGIIAYNLVDALDGITVHDIRQYRIPFVGNLVFVCIKIIIFVFIYMMSSTNKKWAIRAIAYSFYAQAVISGVSMLWLILFFGSYWEPSIFEIVYPTMTTFLRVLMPALLIRQYLTKSLRVKNTYIK